MVESRRPMPLKTQRQLALHPDNKIPLNGKPELIIWRFVDGKPGHDNQSLGLVRALGQRLATEVYELPVLEQRRYGMEWLLGRLNDHPELPAPGLILGAGHATHLPMLRSRRMRGGRIVVLMRPSLPQSWFDLCILPAHDRHHPGQSGLLITRGVLNAIAPAAHSSSHCGLFLIGGPSDHFHWDTTRVVAAIAQVMGRHPEVHWRLTTSRRTPAAFLTELQQAVEGQLEIVPHQHTDRDWVPQQLQQCGRIWVSADSVSMIYEALTAGARVGLLPLAPQPHDRVAMGIQQLTEDHWVQTLEQGDSDHPQPAAPPFNEAARCAAWMLDHWLTPA